jgi:hypothetical protein
MNRGYTGVAICLNNMGVSMKDRTRKNINIKKMGRLKKKKRIEITKSINCV